jgi:ATP-dependent Clp protease ATP-binding subunit ClpA
MKPPFDDDARRIIDRAQAQARELGHRGIGCEHLLFAVSESTDPAGAVLRERGLTPARVTEQTRHLLAGRPHRLDVLDADSLAALGIDLHAVRRAVDSTFGPLPRPASRPGTRRGRLRPGRTSARRHLPVTDRARRCLDAAVREAKRTGDATVGTTVLALAVVTADGGLVPGILNTAGTSATALRTAILEGTHRSRCCEAGPDRVDAAGAGAAGVAVAPLGCGPACAGGGDGSSVRAEARHSGASGSSRNSSRCWPAKRWRAWRTSTGRA